MAEQGAPVTQAPPSRGFSLLFLVVVGALGAFLGHSLAGAPAEEGPEVILRPSPDVVVALRELARLEGMVVYAERVIDLCERKSVFFDLLGVEDAILLVAGGEVVAGVDLRGLGPSSVDADLEAKRARVTLPRATIFSRRLDNDRTYVHTRTTDPFARREDLETRARQEAERMLEKAALEAGILERAEASVQKTVEGLLRSLGFEDVEVRFDAIGGGEAALVGGPG